MRELVRRFPQDEVYVTTDLPEYFERLGFLRTEILPPELEAKIARVEGVVRSGVVGMVYDRRIEQRPTLADVYRAKHAIEPYLQRTPLVHNPYLSRLMGCEAYLKLENLQPIGAFKVRGGVNLAALLPEEDRRRGIVGASTGNHGQSLAYAAKLVGMRCVIAMPRRPEPAEGGGDPDAGRRGGAARAQLRAGAGLGGGVRPPRGDALRPPHQLAGAGGRRGHPEPGDNRRPAGRGRDHHAHRRRQRRHRPLPGRQGAAAGRTGDRRAGGGRARRLPLLEGAEAPAGARSTRSPRGWPRARRSSRPCARSSTTWTTCCW